MTLNISVWDFKQVLLRWFLLGLWLIGDYKGAYNVLIGLMLWVSFWAIFVIFIFYSKSRGDLTAEKKPFDRFAMTELLIFSSVLLWVDEWALAATGVITIFAFTLEVFISVEKA